MITPGPTWMEVLQVAGLVLLAGGIVGLVIGRWVGRP
jgi:hypothetical protein